MDIVIPIPVYRVVLRVCITSNKKVLNALNREICHTLGGEKEKKFRVRGRAYDVYINHKDERTAVILIDREKLTHGVIAHEAMHSVFYIMSYVDIPLTPESEEAYTCLNEYIIQSIYNGIPKGVL